MSNVIIICVWEVKTHKTNYVIKSLKKGQNIVGLQSYI